ncbi:glycosyltransferase family 2 protein [Pseudomonas caspiana]|uniref:glycosyltransferase family 2 protein n=1 Tax=Pseudomonas caspiana TaxID=1451454 RepID=UPI0032EB050C
MTSNLVYLEPKVAVVIPCFKVCRHILSVIKLIGREVTRIYVVDDKCPEGTGLFVKEHCTDPRVKVIFNPENRGVGGAVMAGYVAALAESMSIIVKVDGDGQMNPALIPDFIAPILSGEADYTKGNRFYNLEEIRQMPTTRLLGNTALSFMTKLSSGYWDLFDPTNGYTAIHLNVVKILPLGKISSRYFFETDMLFRLNTLRAVVIDIPMDAQYADEISNLKISRIASEFLVKNIRNTAKRIFYNYYLRDMSLASFELPLGIILLLFGTVFGLWHWMDSIHTGTVTSAGTVMLSALPVLLGTQLILAFIGYDVQSIPKRPLHLKHHYVDNSGSKRTLNS